MTKRLLRAFVLILGEIILTPIKIAVALFSIAWAICSKVGNILTWTEIWDAWKDGAEEAWDRGMNFINYGKFDLD